MQEKAVDKQASRSEPEAHFKAIWVDQQRALIERLERSGRYPGHAKEMLRQVEAHASALAAKQSFPGGQ